jgi:rod shape-determining protein MreC
MENFFSRYKDLVVLFAVLFAQFIGLATQIRHPLPDGHDRHNVRLWRYWVVALVAPPEKILHSIGSGTRGMWDNYIDLRHTREENQRLLAEVNRLHLEQAGLIEDARQGQRLQSLLSFKEHYIYQTEPAEVIGTAGTDQSRILYINKGSKDGLAPDMPVITPDGVVGRLKDVFPHTSQVLAINDQTSGAGVLLESTRLRGVLRGNVYGQPQIINILPDERIKPGEQVVTSGGDQIFPRGLPVGTVESVEADPEHDPYVDVIIKPAANLSHLEEVLVVTQMSDQMPPSAQADIARSEADGAVDAEKLRASDILAEKLPSLADPDDPTADTPEPETKIGLPPLPPPPPKPLQTLHPDRYSPSATPPASDLTPGAKNRAVYAAPSSPGNDGSDAVTPRPKTKPSAPPADAGDAATAADGTPKPRKPAPRKVQPPSDASSPEPATVPDRPAPVTPPPSTPQAFLHIPFNVLRGPC